MSKLRTLTAADATAIPGLRTNPTRCHPCWMRTRRNPRRAGARVSHDARGWIA